MKSITKNKVLLAGVLGSATIGLVSILIFTGTCTSSDTCVSFFVKYDPWYWVTYLFISPFLLFISLLTYKMKAIVFESWKKFAIWGVPIVLTITWYLTRDTGGGGFFGVDFTFEFLLILYGLFTLISLVLIFTTAIKHRRIK